MRQSSSGSSRNLRVALRCCGCCVLQWARELRARCGPGVALQRTQFAEHCPHADSVLDSHAWPPRAITSMPLPAKQPAGIRVVTRTLPGPCPWLGGDRFRTDWSITNATWSQTLTSPARTRRSTPFHLTPGGVVAGDLPQLPPPVRLRRRCAGLAPGRRPRGRGVAGPRCRLDTIGQWALMCRRSDGLHYHKHPARAQWQCIGAQDRRCNVALTFK